MTEPVRKQSEMTVPLDREKILSASAKAAINDAIDAYPDESVRSDRAIQDDRPTLVPCPNGCKPCGCCGGGMVSVDRSNEWQARQESLTKLDEPGE